MRLDLKMVAWLVACLSMVLAGSAVGEVGGAYAGAGPSELVGDSGRCYWRGTAEVVLHGPASTRGTWGVDLFHPGTPFDDCYLMRVGFGAWPSTVTDNLVGSPEQGFEGSGSANRHGTSPGRIEWTFRMGPVGEATEWALTLDTRPYHGERLVSTWSGRADLVGAHA